MPAPDVLATMYAERHPEDAARTLQRLPPADAARFLHALSGEQRGSLLRSMAPTEAGACLVALAPELQGEVVDKLPLDWLAPVVRRIAEGDRTRFIDRLPPGKRRRLNRALRYSDSTAGGMADLDAPTIVADQTILEAEKRSQRRGADLPYVYVTDRSYRLVGVMSRRELARGRSDTRVGALMHDLVQSIPAYAPVEEVAALPGWRDLDAMPVVDGTGVLVGVLRHRTVRRRQTQTASGRATPSTGTGTAIELGAAYCDMLARALVVLTDASSAPASASGPVAPQGESQ